MVAVLKSAEPYRSRFLKLDPERGRFLVHRSAYSSPEIFEEERRRVLRRSWTVLGHESEIREKGDFVVRTVIDRDIVFIAIEPGSRTAYVSFGVSHSLPGQNGQKRFSAARWRGVRCCGSA